MYKTKSQSHNETRSRLEQKISNTRNTLGNLLLEFRNTNK